MILITPLVILPFSYKVASAYEGECREREEMKENLYGYGAIALWLMGILVLLSAFWWY